MKKVVAGLAIGLVLGLAIPAGAHKDAGTSNHLYKHFHQLAHRVIALEEIVVDMDTFIAEMDAELIYLQSRFDTAGNLKGLVSSEQVRAPLGCDGKPAGWTNSYYGEAITLAC